MKSKKLPKTKFILFLLLLLAISIPIIYVFTTIKLQDAQAWYNISWGYRRPVTVGNTGSELTNEDVLIVYDTAALVTGGKLQSDCDDLRFVDSDDTTALSYWVEGGCNTTTTHVWVRIPTLPNGGKTIYMYYGNSSATNAEQTWTGKFYLMKTAACDTGWTTESNTGGAFFERFPKGASTFSGTGGLSSHTHPDSTLTTSEATAPTEVRSQAYSVATTHTHNITLTTQSTSALPSYLDMIFCSNTDLLVKQNTVTLFDATVPTGFTRFSALDSAFPRGNSSYTGTQGGTTQHSHTVNGATSDVPGTTIGARSQAGTTAATSTHTHSITSFTSGNGTHIPEYLTMIYGQANSDIMAPTSTIVMTNATPPLGWTRFTALDTKYPYGSSSYGTTGGTATHTHSVSANTGNESAIENVATGTGAFIINTHTHSVSGNLQTYSNDPPYIETMFFKKKTSQSASLGTEENPGTAPNAPSSLLTEGVTNPTGVIDTTPEFSAVFSDTDTGNTGNYYQIQVNTNNTFTGTEMWDSTKTSIGPITNGARSPDISYNGLALSTNGTTYYWRMKFWDNIGLESTWSATAQFTMASSPNAPSSLTTDGLTNPTAILKVPPYFSAVHTDPGSDSAEYYEIDVNTNNAFSGTVMWASGKTAMTSTASGSRSPEIMYAGTDLTGYTNTVYYWRIRFWNSADLVGTWSSTAQFNDFVTYSSPAQLLNGVNLENVKID